MFASRSWTWDFTFFIIEGLRTSASQGVFCNSGTRPVRSFLTACKTPLLKLGSFGRGGKASWNRDQTTVVARTSSVSARFDSFDPGGLGDSSPSKMPVCDVLCALSYILGSVPTSRTGVYHVPSSK